MKEVRSSFSRSVDNLQDMCGVCVADGVVMASSSPRLGVSQAGDDSGSGPSPRFSIAGTSPVPPASAENTQMMSLDPTVQPIDPLIWILTSEGLEFGPDAGSL